MARALVAVVLSMTVFLSGCGTPSCPAAQTCAQSPVGAQMCRQSCTEGLDGGDPSCPSGTTCQLAPICCAQAGGCPSPRVSVCCPPSGC